MTIPELLVVVAIIGMAVVVSYSMVVQTLGSVRLRAAADQFAMTIKAVRMVAVTRQGNTDLVIAADPLNRYSYVDIQGRQRSVRVPPGVKLSLLAGPATVTFRPNGSVAAELAARFEYAMPDGSVRGWIVTSNLLGVSRSTPFTE